MRLKAAMCAGMSSGGSSFQHAAHTQTCLNTSIPIGCSDPVTLQCSTAGHDAFHTTSVSSAKASCVFKMPFHVFLEF